MKILLAAFIGMAAWEASAQDQAPPAALPGMGGESSSLGPPQGAPAQKARAAPKAPEAAFPRDNARSAAPKAPEAAFPRDNARSAAPGGLPTEVVIKGEEGTNKLGVQKPSLRIEVDPYESIRPSLAPDRALLLAVSPMTVSWRRTHPEFLYNERVIQPWRTTFSQRPGIAFRLKDQLADVLQRRLEPKEAKNYAWSLTIADEEGRVFHHYEGSSDPPEEILWTGQNDQGEWIRAGRSYSAVYTFTDPGGSPRTSVGKPLLFRGIVHQEDTGMHVSLDSTVLFGSSKSSAEVAAPAGAELLRSSADLIKRRFTGIPIAVRVFAATKELGDAQASAIYNFLLHELMLTHKNIGRDAARTAFSDQRSEIVLLNR